MKDERLKQLAKNLVNYSCGQCKNGVMNHGVKKGDKVLIEAVGVDYQLVTELVKQVYAVGAFPFVNIIDQRVLRELQMGLTEEGCDAWAKYDAFRMSDMQCYIGVRGGGNAYESSDVPSDKIAIYNKHHFHPVHHEIRVAKTKWVVLRYPSPSMAQMANMSTDAFEDFYFKVCNLDYSKMNKAMDALAAYLHKTDKVRIVGPGTDLSFSIKGINNKKCSGEINIPDGEIYTAPVKTSVNGTITYNTPTSNNGAKFNNIALTFKDGKIIKETADGKTDEKLTKIFDTDEGARYVGEFAIGVNPYITRAMGDILFDEKIAGSIHFTPGSCYEECSNGNNSAIHWDLVLIQTPECGGGEIYFDGKLIRKDGRFVIKELEGLNPENLI